MKRILPLILFASIFLACTEEDDNRLIGTSFYTEDINYETQHGGECYEIYHFISDSKLDCYILQNGYKVYSYGEYVYDLDYPYITIYTNSGSVRYYTFIDSRTMVLDGSVQGEYYANYYMD